MSDPRAISRAARSAAARALLIVAVVVALAGCGAAPAGETAVRASTSPLAAAPGDVFVPAPPASPRAQPDEAVPAPTVTPTTAPVESTPGESTPAESTPGESTPGEMAGKVARPGAATLRDDSSTRSPDDAASYELSRNPDGSVVRWDPCRTVEWRANLALAPVGALGLLQSAFGRLSAATGMTFRYGGLTTDTPTDSWLSGSDETGAIVVAWATKAGSDLWADQGDGRGGWYSQGVTADGTSWTWQVVRGFVLIDPFTTVGYANGFGAGVSLGALVLHELGHAVGLAHVGDSTQLMFPTLSASTIASYADGDLQGLDRVGAEPGCIGAA